MEVDLLIGGGTLVDGTGAAGRRADLAVVGDRLRVVEPGASVAARDRIDAAGRVVAPGFIDLHSHSGLQVLAEPLHEPKVRQGVTTEVIGVDGLSYAPLTRHDLHDLVEMNAGLDGRPDVTYD
ncbi:MAG TPA: amidohydrolase family protein, partial [Candidatus Limnocylindrales bacterium]|nr:amidohydrolase family protein [Candidatus Limnocylindrales bacterium]